jgi:hypothetical protein
MTINGIVLKLRTGPNEAGLARYHPAWQPGQAEIAAEGRPKGAAAPLPEGLSRELTPILTQGRRRIACVTPYLCCQVRRQMASALASRQRADPP